MFCFSCVFCVFNRDSLKGFPVYVFNEKCYKSEYPSPRRSLLCISVVLNSGFMSTLLEKGSHSIASSSSFVDLASCNNSPSSPDDLDDEENEFKHNIGDAGVHVRTGHEATMGGISVPHHGLSAAFHSYHAHNHNNNNNNKSPFLLPAQLYKSLFANAVLQNPEKMCSHPFPRNLLFSYADKSPNSDFETDDKNSLADEVRSESYLLNSFFSFSFWIWWKFSCLLIQIRMKSSLYYWKLKDFF